MRAERAQPPPSDGQGLKDRFPALRRLERHRPRRVPVVEQNHVADCGPACLAAVLRYFGSQVRLPDVRDQFGAGRDGVTAQSLLDVAKRHGLLGRAVRMELEDLKLLPQGTILHWEMSHFVVLDRVRRDGIDIMDPARGRRHVGAKELDDAFTGIALLFETTQRFAPVKGDRSRVLQYVKELLLHSGLIGRIMITSLLIQVFALGLPVLTGLIVDRVVPHGDTDLLRVAIGGVAMITVFSLLSNLLRSYLLIQLQTNLDMRLTLNFVDHMMRLPFEFFQLRQTGDLLMRLNSNTTIREMLTSTAVTALLDGGLVFTYVVVLMLVHPALGSVVLGLGFLRVAVYVATRHRYRDLTTELLQAQAASSDYQVQMLEGIETIKSTGAEGRAVQHWSNLFVDVMNILLDRGRLNAVVQSTMGALSVASPLVLLGYGAHLVLTDQLSLGTMLAMNALAAGFLTPLSSLVQTGLKLQTLGSYVDRVDDVLSKEPERGAQGARTAPDLLGTIELKNLSFRYSDAGPWAVDDVSVEIPSGSRVAVVGRSGSGKSSLARLLVALYQPEQGAILYDGLDLRDRDVDTIRRQIGFVPQFPFLFGASIRDNISLTDPDAPLETIERAAQMACIHDEIVQMPLHYETPVASGGASLAGGQCQRIAMARALLRRPPILVLDEATSNLDAIAERKIHENLSSIQCTQVIIAHRLSTVVDADLILVMDHGKVIERGTHDELLARRGSYANLFENQMKGVRDRSAE